MVRLAIHRWIYLRSPIGHLDDRFLRRWEAEACCNSEPAQDNLRLIEMTLWDNFAFVRDNRIINGDRASGGLESQSPRRGEVSNHRLCEDIKEWRLNRILLALTSESSTLPSSEIRMITATRI